jgi:hypothetical protein
MMSGLIKTEHETITVIPTVVKYYANHLLLDAGIEFESIPRRDLPDGTPLECVFRGRHCNYENISGIRACVDSESLLRALEEMPETKF